MTRILQFNVGGQVLCASSTMWDALQGPKPDLPMAWESDGCSGGAPDTWRTLGGKVFKLWLACVIHDYQYRYRFYDSGRWLTGAGGRKLADDTLRANIIALVKLQGGRSFTAHRIAWLYWGRVRIWGVDSWQHWGEGQRPKGFLARVREAYGLE